MEKIPKNYAHSDVNPVPTGVHREHVYQSACLRDWLSTERDGLTESASKNILKNRSSWKSFLYDRIS